MNTNAITPDRIAHAYLATWNEPEPARRAARLAQDWTPDSAYVDPMAAADGAVQIDGLIGAVRERFAGFRFTLLGTPDGHGRHVRLKWSLGPEGAEAPIEGSDVIELREGRIHRVVGFLDKLPAGAA